MAIAVVIANIDRSSYLDHAESGKGGQTRYTTATGQRGTATVSLRAHPGDTYAPLVGNPISLYDQAGHRVFGGLITEIIKTNEGNTQEISYVCTCASFERMLDKHRIKPVSYFNQTADYIFKAIFNSLPGETITLGQVDAGPVIASAVYRHEVVTDVFNNLATEANFIWGVDPATEQLYFRSPTSVNAPFDLTGDPATGAGALYDSVQWDTAQQDFRSRQYITVNLQPSMLDTELITGDGTTTTFTLSHPADTVAAVTILGGAATSVGTATTSDLNTAFINVTSVIYHLVSAFDGTSGEIQVLRSGYLSTTLQNLADAINGAPKTGSNYQVNSGAPVPPNPKVTASLNGNNITVAAIVPGTSGNSLEVGDWLATTSYLTWSGPSAGGVLVYLSGGSDGPTRATVDGVFNAVVSNNETATIDGITYKFVTQLDNTVPYQVLIGVNADTCAVNLAEAISGAPHPAAGADFSLPTMPHPTCVAAFGGGGTGKVSVYAKTPGSQGNAIAVSASSLYFFWGAPNLSGGIDGPTIAGTIGTGGTGQDWAYTEGANIVTSTTPLPAGVIAAVSYYRLGVDIIGVENTALAQTRAAVEGGSGIYQALIDVSSTTDPVANNPAAAISSANSLLTNYGLLTQTLTFYTDSAGWQPGQALKVSMAPPFDSTLNGTWLTSQIDGAYIPGMAGWRCQVQAIAMSLNGRAASADMRANTPVVIPRKATWQMLWQRLATINPRRQKPGGGILGSANILAAGGTPPSPGGGGGIAPPVTIHDQSDPNPNLRPKIIFRSDGNCEIDLYYTPTNSGPTVYSGVACYLEDPDISSQPSTKLDNSTTLDKSTQLSGVWAPLFENDSVASPAVLLVDNGVKGKANLTYRRARNVRIYLASYGPTANPQLVRANLANPTPSIIVNIPLPPSQYQSGEEYAWLVTACSVDVTDYFDQAAPATGGAPPPCYTLSFGYLPPDSTLPLPVGLSPFAGVQITYVYIGADGQEAGRTDGPFIPKTASGDIDAATGRAFSEFTSGGYAVGAGGVIRVYFRSQDVNGNTNTLVSDVTPYVLIEVVYPPPQQISTPDILNFVLSNPRMTNASADGTILAEVDAAWTPPDSQRFAGVRFYHTQTNGAEHFPADQIGPFQGDSVSQCTLATPNWPNTPTDWTITAVAVGSNGANNDDPSNPAHSPSQIWHIGPGSPGGGSTAAPLVTLAAGAAVSDIASTSADGTQMVQFVIGAWVNPDPANAANNNFGGVDIAMAINGNVDPSALTWWSAPKGDVSLTSPAMPVLGNFVTGTQLDFYLVSRNMQGERNPLQPGTTPNLHFSYVPGFAAPPTVTQLKLENSRVVWLGNQNYVAECDLSWDLKTTDPNYTRLQGYQIWRQYAGPPNEVEGFSFVPLQMTGTLPTSIQKYTLQVDDLPTQPETWVLVAVPVDTNGVLFPDPHSSWWGQGSNEFGIAAYWNINPAPTPGTPGGGQEYAPLVNASKATVTVKENTSSDGIRQAQFTVSGWVNPLPTDPLYKSFGGVWVAMVQGGDVPDAIYWQVPPGVAGAPSTTFTTPWIPAPGQAGVQSVLDFYIVSQDPAGNRNSITSVTPKAELIYTPTQGQIKMGQLPSNWWNPAEFSWPNYPSGPTTGDPNTGFIAKQIQAGKIFVGSILRVGGAPASSGLGPSFAGLNGQIAVYSGGVDPIDNGQPTLRAWFGQQATNLPDGSQGIVYGGWLSALYVGGHDPTTAPFYVNNGGVLTLGGWDVKTVLSTTYYPYMSVRDKYGIEKGRIGAALDTASYPGFTLQGAWFQELAVGGADMTQWKMLAYHDGTFKIRDTDLFSIDYAATLTGPGPLNLEYKIEFGKSVWGGAGLPSASYQFPGIRIYEVDRPSPTAPNLFGSMLLNRGLVLRGTGTQNYGVLASLVTWNGQQSGIDTPGAFWGELAMYSPNDPTKITVYLASGSATDGGGYFYVNRADASNSFYVHQDGSIFMRGPVSGPSGSLIDSSGNWVGGQKWNADVNANNYNLISLKGLAIGNPTTYGLALMMVGSEAVFQPPSNNAGVTFMWRSLDTSGNMQEWFTATNAAGQFLFGNNTNFTNCLIAYPSNGGIAVMNNNLGIGTGSSIFAPLDIRSASGEFILLETSAAAGQGDCMIEMRSNRSANQFWKIGTGTGGATPNDNFRFIDNTAFKDVMNLAPGTGYVGINTVIPACMLHIVAPGTGPQIAARFGNSDTNGATSEARIVFDEAGNWFQGISGSYANGIPALTFSAAGTANVWAERMRITSNGRVLIGLTVDTRTDLLQVWGAMAASSYNIITSGADITGATGTFKSGDATPKTITVTGGIITGIA